MKSHESNTSLPLNIQDLWESGMVSRILSFTNNRKDFRNFQGTCRFFNSNLDFQTYNQLPAPSLDFRAYIDRFPQDPIRLIIEGGKSISTILQLSNGKLLAGTYADQNKCARLCLWQIASGKILGDIIIPYGEIVSLAEITSTAIAVASYYSRIEFYNSNTMVKLADLCLGSAERVKSLKLIAPGKLVYVSYNAENHKYQVSVTQFNPENIHTSTIISTVIMTINESVGNNAIFSLKNDKFVITTKSSLYIFNLRSKNEDKLEKIITFPNNEVFPYSCQLNDNKIATVFVTQTTPACFVLYIWDVEKEGDNALIKKIDLPFNPSDKIRGVCTMFQRRNGEIIILPEAVFSPSSFIQIKPSLSFLEVHIENLNLKLYHSAGMQCQFIEDGRYYLSVCGARIDCYPIPLLKENPTELQYVVKATP